MSGPMNKNTEFNAKMALTFAEYFDGISPRAQRVSLRLRAEADELEMQNSETQSTTIWRLSKMRRFDGLADDSSMTFAADNTDPARLVVDEVNALRAILTANSNMKVQGSDPKKARKAFAFAGVALGMIAGLVLFAVPTLASRATDMVLPEREIAFGEQMFGMIYTQAGYRQCANPAGQVALDQMGARLSANANIGLPLTIRVINDPMPQATALPGGHITIYSGLIAQAENPNEVAAVLAHEIGHVAHRDGTRAALQAMGSFGLVGLAFGDVFGTTAVAGVTQSLIASSHSREAETNADAYAHRMLENADISPRHLASFFTRLEDQGMATDIGVFQHLSSHPELADRIDATMTAADDAMLGDQMILSDAEWAALQTICGGGAAPAKS